jgi:hypothetical protein
MPKGVEDQDGDQEDLWAELLDFWEDIDPGAGVEYDGAADQIDRKDPIEKRVTTSM